MCSRHILREVPGVQSYITVYPDTHTLSCTQVDKLTGRIATTLTGTIVTIVTTATTRIAIILIGTVPTHMHACSCSRRLTFGLDGQAGGSPIGETCPKDL